MQINFRYTDQEYLELKKLNQMVGFNKWKAFGVVTLSLIPSFCLAIASTEKMAPLMGFALVSIMIFAVMIWAVFQASMQVDQFDHRLTMTEESLRQEISHSASECRWRRFDGFIETENDFRLQRMERFVVLPKRSFSDSQQEEMRRFAQAINEEAAEGVASNGPPIGLYRKYFLNSDESPEGPQSGLLETQKKVAGQAFQFAYEPSDLTGAFGETLRVIDPSQPESAKKQVRLGCWPRTMMVAMALILIVIGYRTVSDPFSAQNESTLEFVNLVLVVLLPFVFLFSAMRFIRARDLQRLPKVPKETLSLILARTGFAFGGVDNVSFNDWQDVDSFMQNSACYGFKIPNQLIQIIPKRIFADEAESERFINHAMALHQEHLRSFVVTAVAVESDNPYQAPGQ